MGVFVGLKVTFLVGVINAPWSPTIHCGVALSFWLVSARKWIAQWFKEVQMTRTVAFAAMLMVGTALLGRKLLPTSEGEGPRKDGDANEIWE